MNEQIKQMREVVIGIARLLEQQETVVAARKAAGRGTKRAEALENKLRRALQFADRQAAAAKNKAIAAYMPRAVQILSAGVPIRKPAAEILVRNIFRKVNEIFAAGGSVDDARTAALKQFKETAGSFSDPWFREVARRLHDLAGLGL